jgi:hypothetical protein
MPFKDPEQNRKYQNERIIRARLEWLSTHGPCVKCGSWNNLNVDHIDPKLKVSHRIWSWSKERREIELAKCQVLCEPCHWIKTALDNGHVVGGKHGASKYHKGCRCDICKEAHAKQNSEYRSRAH